MISLIDMIYEEILKDYYNLLFYGNTLDSDDVVFIDYTDLEDELEITHE